MVMRNWTAVMVMTLAPAGFAAAQTSSLYKASQMQQQQAAAGAATSQPAGDGVPATVSPAVSATAATNGALRVNAGSTPVPSAPRNLAVARYSLTSVSPPEPTLVKVNDLIGVIIRHRFRAQTDSRLQQKSEWDVATKLDAWFRIHDRKMQQQDFGGGKPEVKFTNENEMKNQGRTNRQDVVETRVMGKVIDVKPNGNLIIVAASKIEYGEDAQVLMLSGEINGRDVTPDRTVTSDKIYDLDVEIKNEGAVQDAVKRGWLKEILDTAKPF